MNESTVIVQTNAWIKSVVIGCNFCPFAAKAMLRQSIRYTVLPNATIESSLETLSNELQFLDKHDDFETTLIIFQNDFGDFNEYLDLVEIAETLNSKLGYDGVYQIASFHPAYLFEGSEEDDPANYTNRSVYPMLHILREESITLAVELYPDTEAIPKRNIEYAKEKGLKHMQLLRAACFNV
ncbi:MAG: DUF1415 domain-containing protein [Saprospiraceae bacterium]